ncbi:hypothetical protein BVRB_5g097830 isoform B [Beta vulgaris subsp. vulgaris]|nr:hypothetical protein BVRB_5g097830 isoform B [Beta vulgaris subsp. vulgaris]
MLDRDHLDLNCAHSSADSFKETLKQTMLIQELVFRRQAELAQSENVYLHYELQQEPHVFTKKPLGLQLSADEFISQCVDNFSGKGEVIGCSKESIVYKNSSQDKAIFYQNNLNLSLSIREGVSKKYGEQSSWKGKKTFSTPFGIIDLEDANQRFTNYEANLGFNYDSAAPKSCSKDEHKLDHFLKSGKQNLESFPQSGIKDGSYGTTLSISPVDTGPSSQTKSLCDSGSNAHHRKLLAANLLENQKPPTCKVFLDLNTVLLEDPSHSSHDHSVVVNSSITSSSPELEKVHLKSNVASSVRPTSCREANMNQVTEMHDIHREKDVYLRGNQGEKSSKDGKLKGDVAHASFVDLDSDTSEELCSSRSDSKISSVGSSTKILNGLSCEMDLVNVVRAEANLVKGVESFEQPHYCKLSNSSESECMIFHHSSSTKTMQSGVQCDDINFSISHPKEQDQRSSDTTESNIQCITLKEPEVDGTVQSAAELLLQLKNLQIEEDNQPQCSSESYEAMVLKAEECSPDNYCVSSNAFLVDQSDKTDIRYKLKRGTRMKDFQKDILPSLSTLSRHEIREDINILEGVIRSREYKRMRAKMGDGGSDWCRSTRSKRSKVRRHYV